MDPLDSLTTERPNEKNAQEICFVSFFSLETSGKGATFLTFCVGKPRQVVTCVVFLGAKQVPWPPLIKKLNPHFKTKNEKLKNQIVSVGDWCS